MGAGGWSDSSGWLSLVDAKGDGQPDMVVRLEEGFGAEYRRVNAKVARQVHANAGRRIQLVLRDAACAPHFNPAAQLVFQSGEIVVALEPCENSM